MKIVSIFAGHDSNITFTDTESNKYHIIEIERLVKKRYFRLHVDNDRNFISEVLKKCQGIAEKYWGFSNEYDEVIYVSDGALDHSLLSECFNSRSIRLYGDHHHCHAASTFYQSGYEESIIISYDGGGNDGFFNVYLGDREGIKLLEKIDSDFGGGYLLLSSCIKEISEKSSHMLSLAGKMMGICAYGIPNPEKSKIIEDFFIDRDYRKMSRKTGYNLLNEDSPWGDPLNNYKFSGEEGFNFAATAQLAYENKFIKILDSLIQKYSPKNLCITGGGGLNVLLNQRIKDSYELSIFVPPNPNDCGLSLGASFLLSPPKEKIEIAYKGLPILDVDNLENLLSGRKYKKLDFDEICQLLKQGKIIGICRGDSEVGPRALGNRSIICDPSYENMKDILNSKVKFREWYRPFAPFCLEEDANKYFTSKDFENLQYMGYAPLVKEEYSKKLPSVTHKDKSSRLQTVTEKSHKFFYDLLNKFSEYSEVNVLLNTSFNIRGNPILTTAEDALYVLDNTDLDYVVIENLLIEKN
jgi:carbamoyltransferase